MNPRKCTGCRAMKPRSELIRIVRSEGAIQVDPSGKKAGRGAYICNAVDCLQKARKARGLERSFKGAVPSEIYERLAAEILSEVI